MTERKKRTELAPLLFVITLIVVFAVLILFAVLQRDPASPEETTTSEHTSSLPATSVALTFPMASSPYIDNETIDTSDLTWHPATETDVYEVDGETRIFSSISYPVFSGIESDALALVNETLKNYAMQFATIRSETKLLADEDYLHATERDMAFDPYEFAADYRSVYLRGSLLSILFTHTRTMGGANTYPTYDALCFDLSSGEAVNFAALIGRSDEEATVYLTDVFTQMILASPNDYHTDVLETLPWLVDLTSFYLSEEGVTFYFAAEAISPSVYGIRSLTIPYEKLSG